MNIYIYPDVDELTSNYHDGGGLVVITDRDPLDAYNDHTATVGKYEAMPLTELPEPENIIVAQTSPERVYVFPNAGCC